MCLYDILIYYINFFMSGTYQMRICVLRTYLIVTFINVRLGHSKQPFQLIYVWCIYLDSR